MISGGVAVVCVVAGVGSAKRANSKTKRRTTSRSGDEDGDGDRKFEGRVSGCVDER